MTEFKCGRCLVIAKREHPSKIALIQQGDFVREPEKTRIIVGVCKECERQFWDWLGFYGRSVED